MNKRELLESTNCDSNKRNIRSRSRSRSRACSNRSPKNKIKTHHSRGIYRHYTIEYKLHILKIAANKTNSYIEKEYGIDSHLLNKWKRDKEMLEASTNKKNSIKIIKNGGIPSTFEYDGYISNYVKELRANNIPVNTNDIILKAKEIVESFKDRSIDSLKSWAYRFIKRMGFTYRVITKEQTKLRSDILDYVRKFYTLSRKVIKEKNLLNSIENIGNADETPIFMEMNEKKTLNIIGEKEIKIKTFKKSHIRVSVMLTILGGGNSLHHLLYLEEPQKEQKKKN